MINIKNVQDLYTVIYKIKYCWDDTYINWAVTHTHGQTVSIGSFNTKPKIKILAGFFMIWGNWQADSKIYTQNLEKSKQSQNRTKWETYTIWLQALIKLQGTHYGIGKTDKQINGTRNIPTFDL